MFLTVQLNVTLMFDLKKNTIKEVSDNDRIAMQYASIDADLTNWYMNITAPNPEYGYCYILTLPCPGSEMSGYCQGGGRAFQGDFVEKASKKHFLGVKWTCCPPNM